MSVENELIQALKVTIASKDDLITHLKAEIDRLNASQIVVNPIQPPIRGPVDNTPSTIPGRPFVEPYSPYEPRYPSWPIQPQTPWYQPPYVVTCGESEAIKSGSIFVTGTTISNNISGNA